MKNNYTVPVVDTDSITICKQDFSEFSKEELDKLTEDLNSKFDELINWEFEFYNPKIIVLKSKNYILYDGKKIKVKGSALKASTKCPALKELIKSIIDYLVYNDTIDNQALTKIYESYVKEATNVKDIKRWATRKTISDKVLESDRTNEAKVREAIAGTEIVEGDRCYVYYKEDSSLSLVENFDGNYNKTRLLKNVYDTAQIFDTVLDCDVLFLNYSLKRNQQKLQELLNG